MRIGFQGEAFSYSDQAGGELFPDQERVGFATFVAAFEALRDGEVGLLVLPIENSTTGSVLPVLDRLVPGKVHIIGEHLVEVRHCLLASPTASLDTIERVHSHPEALLSDGTEMPCDLLLGVPVHRVPQVVVESGLAADAFGWVPVNKKTLETTFPGVYAVGDVNGVGTPKAGVFAEGAAQIVAAAIIAQLRGGPSPEAYKGAGSCYVEFGHNQVGRVDVDFLSGPKPTGTFRAPSDTLVAEKADFGSSRLRRWFGRLG
jgi:hypothetical protein